MSTLKKIAKRAVVGAIGHVAPITWRWRRPGSLVVLMYHRVLPKDSPARATEQPGMYVSPETLDMHLAVLKQHFELVHLDDWLRRAKQGAALPRLACAITFDDGWRDNYEFGLPVLQKHGAPATIFLVSGYIGTTYRFWPNRLIEFILREHSRPGTIAFPRELEVLVQPILAESARKKAIEIEDIDPIIQQALKFKEDEIRELVEACEGPTVSENARDTLDATEIAAMADTGLIQFGSHSATHFRLHTDIPPARLTAEIVQSKVRLQEICNQPIDVFCYPNGVAGATAVPLVRANYLGAVITETGWHSSAQDMHVINRIRVHEDCSNHRNLLIERVSGWC